MTQLTLKEPDLVEKLEQIAANQNMEPEAVLNQAVREFVAKSIRPRRTHKPYKPFAPPEFLREMAAFERLKPQLLQQYRSRVVAIHDEQVVAIGDDILTVHNMVMKKFGFVPCYVEQVDEDTPHRVRMPSIWKAR